MVIPAGQGREGARKHVDHVFSIILRAGLFGVQENPREINIIVKGKHCTSRQHNDAGTGSRPLKSHDQSRRPPTQRWHRTKATGYGKLSVGQVE